MKKYYIGSPILVLMLLLFMLTLAVATAGATAGPMTTEAIGMTTRVSVASDGAQGNGRSGSPSISDDGRYVAFRSEASNLAPGDTNGVRDVFVHDRVSGETTLASVASDGAQGNGGSDSPSISGDGRYVAFSSEASNLVPGDTNGGYDIFVHDRATGETTRVSVASDGAQGNNDSYSPSISSDGRYVAFASDASNLVPGDTNGARDVLVHDRVTGETTRVSVASDGAQGNGGSYSLSISGDGRYVAFRSEASNLVPGDTNGARDVFVHDRVTGETTRVSVASDGAQAADDSGSASISDDGRYVAFSSRANNLVPEDTHTCDDYNESCWDVFVHDRTTGETIRVSVASDGAQSNDDSGSPSISGDGRYVAFESDASNLVPGDTNICSSWYYCEDIFVHDRVTGETTRVSVASDGAQSNGGSDFPSISADGRYVAFESYASNLAPGDTNGARDVFVHDPTPEYGVALSGYATRFGAPGTMVTFSLTLHNVAIQADSYDLALSGGGWPAAIDGLTTVALASGASSEVAVVVSVPAGAKAGTGDTVMLSATSQGNPDLNATANLTTMATFGATTRVSVASDGAQGNDDSYSPSISGDGRYVAFESDASNLVPGDTGRGVFVHDRVTGETTRVSVASDGAQGNDWSDSPSISGDGRYVAFASYASNLAPGDTNGVRDVFVHDRATGETSRVSVSSDGAQGNDWSDSPSISGDGRYVAFASYASNLAPGDTNGVRDVFVHDRVSGETTLASVASDGAQGNDWSDSPSISGDGRYVAFESYASNLAPGDTNGVRDVFVHDRVSGETTLASVASDGAQGNDWSDSPSISGDGRYVAFESYASNLAPGDTNGVRDVFVHDRVTGETTRVSVASDGAQSNGGSDFPSISADGRYVAFESYASNLAPGDTNGARDVFVHDRTTGETTRVSVASDGAQGNHNSRHPIISGDGRYVAFSSEANNLAPGDTNDEDDVFVHDRTTGETTRVSVASDGTQGTEANGSSGSPSISGNGRNVVFVSGASNLVPGDTNLCWDIRQNYYNCSDVFVHDRYFNLPFISYLPFIANR